MTGASALTPTWGYRPDGSAQIFDLAPGEGLPEGWHASPDCIKDSTLATGEALTEAAARAARDAKSEVARSPAPPAPSPVVIEPDAGTVAMAAETGRLRAENATLSADLAATRDRLAAVEDERAQALERVASLSADLDRARDAASAEPVSDDGAAPEPAPQISETPAEPVQSGQPARTRAEAREAVLALLGQDLTDREIARRVGVSPSTVAAVRKSER